MVIDFMKLIFIFSLGTAMIYYRKGITEFFIRQRSWFSSAKKKYPPYSKIDEIILFLTGFIFIILSLLGLADLFRDFF